ncbi:hypothetical protein AMK59_3239 [Oryctes borbonicus]|uniref:Transcription initiation factor TFIID subunit 6 n=1 Tax=Oryctes borbonicus TaxID=1629725 RepID=A0A0T6B5F1_9SCAR|nr:hypothetical protein AMK59_3239 [Oryctes borbonicus]
MNNKNVQARAATLSNKGNISTLNIKSKKTIKDREKRRSIVNTEKNEVHSNSDKGSPSKDSGVRKYAGIGPESVAVYCEQSTLEHLSEEVFSGLAEDLSYKLRYIIHDALIKARLSGRNHILSTDIDATFDDLNIEKVYGASATPNWIALGDQNCYYLEKWPNRNVPMYNQLM